MTGPLYFNQEPSELSRNEKERHEELVDLFGQFIFWLRNSSVRTSRRLIESEQDRQDLGTVRRKPYDDVAQMAPNEREAALSLAERTLDWFLQDFVWCLGDEGIDARFGEHHAYRFRVEMEIVDIESREIVYSEPINRGGKFFGSYWGRWLNSHRKK